jgi:hypothetical protein
MGYSWESKQARSILFFDGPIRDVKSRHKPLVLLSGWRVRGADIN